MESPENAEWGVQAEASTIERRTKSQRKVSVSQQSH
jgi:hypothetical protein